MLNNLLLRSISSALLILISFFFIVKGGYFFVFFLIICLIISLFEWNKMVINKFLSFAGSIFITLSFFAAYHLKIMDDENNILNFLVILLICISTDIGGYIFGNTFKGPKITKISPNKTYAGSIGGFICSLLFLYIFNSFVFLFENYQFNFSFKNITFILILSLISQIGDIVVSYFKRLYNKKDTGNLIPGHGGILDRIDGMIFVFPFALILNFNF